MKKLLKNVILILTATILVSCASNKSTEEKKPAPPVDDSFKLKAIVRSVGEKIEVEVIESDYAFGIYWVITAQGTEYFNKKGKEIERADIAVGDTVEISYGGQVMMSYPPQIVAARIQIK